MTAIHLHRARSTDPTTSHAAAARAARFAESHAGRILAAVRKCGNATAHSISCYTGLSVVQIDRRLPELQRSGLVEVVQQGGQDMVRGGYRVWRAVDSSFAAMGEADREMLELGYGR